MPVDMPCPADRHMLGTRCSTAWFIARLAPCPTTCSRSKGPCVGSIGRALTSPHLIDVLELAVQGVTTAVGVACWVVCVYHPTHQGCMSPIDLGPFDKVHRKDSTNEVISDYVRASALRSAAMLEGIITTITCCRCNVGDM